MSWKDTKQPGDIIKATDWNELADTVIQTSGAFWAHSGNTSNPHNVTLEQARMANNIVSGNIDMNDNKILNLAEPTSIHDATTKFYVDRAVTSLGAAYCMTDETDAETGYKLCSLTPPDASETYIEVSNLSDNQLIGAWISAPDEEPARLLKGVFDWFPTLEKTAGTQTLRVYWKLFERSGSAETEIATSADSNEVDGKASYVIPLLLSDDYTFSSGSRVVGKLYARVEGTGSSPTIRVYYQGNTASRWEIPANSETFRKIFIPYSGAVDDVHLGSKQLTAETLEASSIVLDGYTIDEISNDSSLSDDSPTALTTEHAVRIFGLTNFYPSSAGHDHVTNTSNPHNVTYSQVGAIQDADNTVKSSHIDWGTSTNQVSLDDVPDGATYGKLTITERDDLTDGGDSSLHYHSSDRDLSNATGVLAIGKGGTNNTSFTSDKFLIYDTNEDKIKSSNYDGTSFASATHTHTLDDLSNTSISSPLSGQVLSYLGNWKNVSPPLTFSLPAVGIKGNRYIRLARFTTPENKTAYLWMAQISDINGNTVNGLRIEMLSGSTVVYACSSNTVEIGSPLASTAGDITIRVMYSGAGIGDDSYVQCVGFMQVSII